MKIFLIAGKAESGKGEVAKYIKEYYIYRHEDTAVTSYGKYLKNLAMELTDWDGNPVTKPRKYLQDLGHKIREVNPDFLITNMMKDFTIYEHFVKNIVIEDVRLPDEIDKIRNEYDDVYAIYVENQFSVSKLTMEEQTDITELALEAYNDFDVTIVNDDINKLKDKVFKFLDEAVK